MDGWMLQPKSSNCAMSEETLYYYYYYYYYSIIVQATFYFIWYMSAVFTEKCLGAYFSGQTEHCAALTEITGLI